VGDGLFHPGSGDLSDPGGIQCEESDEGFDEKFDEHKSIVAKWRRIDCN